MNKPPVHCNLHMNCSRTAIPSVATSATSTTRGCSPHSGDRRLAARTAPLVPLPRGRAREVSGSPSQLEVLGRNAPPACAQKRAVCHSLLPSVLLSLTPYRDSPYKREYGRENDRRPSYKLAIGFKLGEREVAGAAVVQLERERC
jgi:hypothetical protein